MKKRKLKDLENTKNQLKYYKISIELQCSICGKYYIQRKCAFKKALWKNRCRNHRKIIKFCPDCGKKIWKTSNKCRKCAVKPLPQIKNFCIDCNKEILKKSKRCLSCWNKFQDKGLSRERTKFQNNDKWIEIRKICFEKDNYTCQKCNSRNGNGKFIFIEAHHIKNWKDYPKLRLNINNLITLCRDCHMETHWGKNEKTKY